MKMDTELDLHKMNTDELTNVYERVGELVGNTNLPRHEEQLIIEFKKLQDKNEAHWDLFWNVSELLKEHIDDYPTHKEGEIYDAIEKLMRIEVDDTDSE